MWKNRAVLAWEALSDLDVETLVRDLFAAEWHTHVESFRRGPDQGIDLRAAGPCGPPLNLQSGTALIAQVKHYPNASASRLRSAFRKEASRKIRPAYAHYVAVTTAKLSLKTKEEIAGLFDPPLCVSDIYGREDLEAMLGRHPEVTQRHIRLWLTETSVLRELLHGRERRFREHVLEDLVKNVPLLAPTRHLAAAAALLNEQGAVIISGPPGAGKTSTAMLLIAAMVQDGWDLVVAEDRLDDAEHLLDETVNQVVYYDDFLGSSLHTLFLAGKNEDRRIIQLLDRAASDPKLAVVLTTREYVLAAARKIHPRLTEKKTDLARLVINATDLDAFERARILYAHLYHSPLQAILNDAAEPDIWLPVLQHAMFSPRLIRMFIEAFAREVEAGSPVPRVHDFCAQLDSAMSDPSALWQTIYEDHLTGRQRQLLQMQATLPHGAGLDDLVSFAQDWAHAAGENSATDSEWRRELRVLDGDFLSISGPPGRRSVSFANESIAGYVRLRISEDSRCLASLIDTAFLFEQVEILWYISTISSAASSPRRFGSPEAMEYQVIETENEIFGSRPPSQVSASEAERLRRSFRLAMVRNFLIGEYRNHPSVWGLSRRWVNIHPRVDRRLARIYDIADDFDLIDDSELADSVIDAFIELIARRQGIFETVYDAINFLWERAAGCWATRLGDVVHAANEYFLSPPGNIHQLPYAIKYFTLTQQADRIPELGGQLIATSAFYLSDKSPWPKYEDSAGSSSAIRVFSRSAKRIGVDISEQITLLQAKRDAFLANSTSDRDLGFGKREPTISKSASRYEKVPKRPMIGDIATASAREAAQLLCPRSAP
jgi:hypothetical protein